MAAAPDPLLVAAVGNSWLADQGFGTRVIESLRAGPLPAAVELASWEFGTIAAVQRLGARRYRRAIFVAAVARGRTPGTLHTTSEPALPPESEIHGRVGDSVMGLVSLDNLLGIGRYYGHLPREVLVVEAEPADETWGNELSPQLEKLVAPAARAVLGAINAWPRL